jgi:AP-2 complex subunit mu-1
VLTLNLDIDISPLWNWNVKQIFVFVAADYRGSVNRRNGVVLFDQIIVSKATGNIAPVVQIEGTTFTYIKHSNLYLVAATRSNPNVCMIIEYLIQKTRILKSYLGEDFDDESVQGSFTLIYELLDETMDFGYPQNCSIDVLRLYINLGSVVQNSASKEGAALTSQITGAIDWRREGIRHRKNEVYIDLHETVSQLTSATGVILRTEVHGKVIMKAFLTGMPECKFGLNDKLIMEKEGTGGGTVTRSGKKISAVEIDDCTFHRYYIIILIDDALACIC